MAHTQAGWARSRVLRQQRLRTSEMLRDGRSRCEVVGREVNLGVGSPGARALVTAADAGRVGHSERERELDALSEVTIYHAGTGKIVFLGITRAAAFLVLGLFAGMVAPAYYFDPGSPTYVTPLLLLGGSLPLAFIAHTTSPFVNRVSVAVPRKVMASSAATRQYVQHLPPSAVLRVETMKFLFWPRISHLLMSQLGPASSRTRPVNFTSVVPDYRPVWQGGSKSLFYAPVQRRPGPASRIYQPEAWPRVLRQIQANRPTLF
ncbi:hypothetical protein KEM52_006357 [Ascosphaera acerosa]|nr:hypothetical protein KEM52_006357 [Ascosphaera acerosa]